MTPASGSMPASASGPAGAWEKIQPFFAPPEKYRDEYGNFRDVLKFDDGTPVKTADDWAKRRKEILKLWHDTMGPWPEVIEKPKFEYVSKEEVEGFTRHKVRVEVAQGRMEELYLCMPKGKGPFPAVLATGYGAAGLAGITKPPEGKIWNDIWGPAMAQRGYVTLCVGGLSQDVRTSDAKNGIQPLSYLAYVAANCANALANLPEVDPKRIGVIGHSFGGKWAMFASCLCDKFAAAVWCDPGVVWNEKDANANYWEPWYLGSEAGKTRSKPGIPTTSNPAFGAYQKLRESGHDMNELHALMAPRPFLVSGGAQDLPPHWVALNHTIRVNRFLGFKDRVAMTIRNGHTPTLESNEQVYAFFEHFLK